MDYNNINDEVDKLHNEVKTLYTKIFRKMQEPKKGIFDEPQGQLTKKQFVKFNLDKHRYNLRFIQVMDDFAFNTKYTDQAHSELLKYKIHTIKHNLISLDALLASVYSQYHLDGLSQLAILSAIFLPLTFIVGWFGMNFNSMGAIKGTKGIFSIIHGQRFVLSLCITSLIIMGLLFKLIQLPGWGY